jgi:hypothetical protein
MPTLIAALPTSVVSTSTSTSTAAPKPTALTCATADGQVVTVGASKFTVACGTDHYGGDLSVSWETSLDNCIATCESTTECIIVSYVGGACYMKSKDNGSQSNANV